MQSYDIQNAFFVLLRSGLWNVPVAQTEYFNKQTDWNSILMLAQEQTVLCLVADAIFRLPEECRPEHKVILKLASSVFVTARCHSLLNATLVHVITLLEENGIYPILLKGQGVASLYHDPTLRMCGDIDLYVGIKDYTRSAQLLIKLVGEGAEYSETEKHFEITLNGVSVELHKIAEYLFTPWQNRRFQLWSDEHLNHNKTVSITISDKLVHIPSPDYNAVYVFNHLWHHFLGGGIGLRQLCDWAMVLHSRTQPLNKEELKAHLKAFGLFDAWRIFGCIVVEQLGLSKDEFPLYENVSRSKVAKVLDRVLLEGNFGRAVQALEKRPRGIILGKLHSLIRVSRRTISMAMVSPVSFAEYYVYFLIHRVMAVPKALRGK